MENTIIDLTSLSQYQNRQVVLNYYHEDDFLWKRDGFEFDLLKADNSFITFAKNGKELLSISMMDFPIITKSQDFQDYYIFQDKYLSQRIELYFPH